MGLLFVVRKEPGENKEQDNNQSKHNAVIIRTKPSIGLMAKCNSINVLINAKNQKPLIPEGSAGNSQ